MIKVNNVSKQIKHNQVLKNINLELEFGKAYLLHGHNGCGKTMLLRLLSDLIRPTSGEVLKKEGLSYGVLIEKPGFLGNYSARYNLEYLAAIQNKIADSEIDVALERVNLLNDAKHKVKTYSLGMKQRLGIAQAIMENQDVLLLDEPFNALDEDNLNRVLEILKEERKKGKLIVVAAHNLPLEISDFFNVKIKLNNGQVKEIVA